MPIHPISIHEIAGVRFGNAQNRDAMTGVTALVFDTPNTCGIDISGGGPAARESFLFTPLAYKQSVNALLLSGGSAFGLAAATGAMRYLEERKIGYKLNDLVIPIVPQSCIFDLEFGNGKIRPDAQMGYDACVDAEKNRPISGNIGGGIGATVGKICGMARAQKSGIGYAAFAAGTLKIGAVVVVNALGDVFDYRNGEKIAGTLDASRERFVSAENALFDMQNSLENGKNTTIGAVIMNADFSQQELCKIAAMTRAALARSINPVGTTADGDTIYAISTGGVKSDVNLAGTLACKCVSEAILDAIKSAKMPDDEFLKFIKI